MSKAMWAAAIAGADRSNAPNLRACLQQTGLIASVAEWDIHHSSDQEWQQRVCATEVVLLNLNGDPAAELAFAADLRRLNPNVRIIAYSSAKQPDSEFLLHAMRSGVQEVLPSPLTATAVQEALTRFYHADSSPAIRKFARKVILLMGSKGGVGTSTIAVNLGVQLAQTPHRRTCVIDLARPVGHIALMLDLQPRFTLWDAIENLGRLDSHYFSGLLTKHKTGLEVLAGLTHPEEWHRVPTPSVPTVVKVAQSACDYVVIDCGSVYSLDLISGDVLEMAQSILMVAEASVPSLWTLERHMTGLSSIGLDKKKVHVVINRWTRADDETLTSLERKLRQPVFARLPNDFRRVSEAVNLGTPLSQNSSSPLVSELHKLALQLGGGAPPSPKKQRFGGIFSFGKKG